MYASLRRIGVILAAGRGGRMGGTKQLKLVADCRRREAARRAAYDAIRPICDEMVVVLGHEADAVAAALGDRPFHRAESDPDRRCSSRSAPAFAPLRIDPSHDRPPTRRPSRSQPRDARAADRLVA